MTTFLVLFLSLLLASCGGSGEGEDGTQATGSNSKPFSQTPRYYGLQARVQALAANLAREYIEDYKAAGYLTDDEQGTLQLAATADSDERISASVTSEQGDDAFLLVDDYKSEAIYMAGPIVAWAIMSNLPKEDEALVARTAAKGLEVLKGRMTALDDEAKKSLVRVMATASVQSLKARGTTEENLPKMMKAVATGSFTSMLSMGLRDDELGGIAESYMEASVSGLSAYSASSNASGALPDYLGSTMDAMTEGALASSQELLAKNADIPSKIAVSSLKGAKRMGDRFEKIDWAEGIKGLSQAAAKGMATLGTDAAFEERITKINGDMIGALKGVGLAQGDIPKFAGAVTSGVIAQISQEEGLKDRVLGGGSTLIKDLVFSSTVNLKRNDLSVSQVAQAMENLVGEMTQVVKQSHLEDAAKSQFVIGQIVSGSIAGFSEASKAEPSYMGEAIEKSSKGATKVILGIEKTRDQFSALAGAIADASAQSVQAINAKTPNSLDNNALMAKMQEGMNVGLNEVSAASPSLLTQELKTSSQVRVQEVSTLANNWLNVGGTAELPSANLATTATSTKTTSTAATTPIPTPSPTPTNTAGSTEPLIAYATVRTILGTRCGSCHQEGSGSGTATVVKWYPSNYSSIYPLVSVSAPSASALLRRATGELPHSGPVLSSLDIDYKTILKWITQGAHNP